MGSTLIGIGLTALGGLFGPFGVVVGAGASLALNIGISIYQSSFGIILDCFVFAINKKTGAFVLNDFIVTIALQIIAIPVIFIIVVLSAKKHNRGKMPTTYKVSFSVGLGVSMLSSIISKFLLTNVSLNVVVTILNCVLTITIYLIWYIVISAIYRAYLVKRYNLNISLEQSII